MNNFILPMVTLTILSCMVYTCKEMPPEPGKDKPDTTSHNFAWQTFVLGDGASSVLNDVAIVNDTLAYAVGEINVKDSASAWRNPPYNLAVWNGRSWQLRTLMFATKILYPGSIGSDTAYAEGHSVFAFNENDIWIAAGTIQHYHDGIWEQFQGEYAGFSNRMWGSSSSSMYFVGNGGTIIHYNGSSWQKVSSGTTLPIRDIWGAKNERTGEWEILAVASNLAAIPQGKALLQINGTTASLVNDAGLPMALSSVWFLPGWRYFVTGDGVYSNTKVGNPWESDTTHPLLYKDAIRGNAKNDIMIGGSYGLVSHFNGSTWKHYVGNELPSFYGQYLKIDFKGDLLVTVGWKDEQAVILTGRR